MTMVEFGVNDGRTAAAMLANIPSIQLYVGVDVPVGTVLPLKVQKNEVPQNPGHLVSHDPKFTLILKHGGSMNLGTRDLPRADVVFIDGDHSAPAVAHDVRLAREILVPGGIIIAHDYHGRDTVGVREVLEAEYDKGHRWQYVENTWIAFERG